MSGRASKTERMTAAEYRSLPAPTEGHQLESDVLKQVRDYLRLLGWLVIRLQQGMGSYRGLSDLVALRHSRTVWIEIKAPKGKQSEHQRKFQADVEAFGGEYRLVRSVKEIEDLRGLEE